MATTAFGVQFNPSDLVTFDTATPGTVTVVGSIGTGFQGLEFGGDGNLYGINSVGNVFAKVNPATAGTTVIGSTGISGFPGDLAWDPVTGEMLASVEESGTNQDGLFSIDLATGAATLLSTITSITGRVDSLAVDAAGDIFEYGASSNQWFQIDRTTFGVTTLGGSGITAATPNGATFIGSTLYWSEGSSLYTVNTSTGAATPVGAFPSGGMLDIAVTPVPEPSSFLLWSSGLGLIFGAARRKRLNLASAKRARSAMNPRRVRC